MQSATIIILLIIIQVLTHNLYHHNDYLNYLWYKPQADNLSQEEKDIIIKEKDTLDILRNQGKASVIVCKNGVCVGIIALSDILREESAVVCEKLSKMGTGTVLLTGDNHKAAEFFAKKAGIVEVKPSDFNI